MGKLHDLILQLKNDQEPAKTLERYIIGGEVDGDALRDEAARLLQEGQISDELCQTVTKLCLALSAETVAADESPPAEPPLPNIPLTDLSLEEAGTDMPGSTVVVAANSRRPSVRPGASSRAKNKLLTVGDTIKNRFVLKEIIGSGGMSVVYRALDLRKHEAKNNKPYVAIKLLGDNFQKHPLSLLALERETQRIQSLAHPNIVTVYDFDRDGDVIYMTMECLDGQSLHRVIQEHRRGMPAEEAYAIIEGICRALIYAHEKNIIHSDFKPENVYYTNNKVAKVLDFGIARTQKLPEDKNVDTVFDAAELGALTPAYASPEMFANSEPDPKDDIYALACVVYKLLSGKHPFNGTRADTARQKKMRPERLPQLTRRQWHALEKGLAFDRDARSATVAEFLHGIMPHVTPRWVYALAALIIISLGISMYVGSSITEQVMPNVVLSEEQKQAIQHYSELAELYVSMGYLASPPGDSALDQYDKILEIDPINAFAIDGKKALVAEYVKLTEVEIGMGRLEQGLEFIETGLQIEPQNSDLKQLQSKVAGKLGKSVKP